MCDIQDAFLVLFDTESALKAAVHHHRFPGSLLRAKGSSGKAACAESRCEMQNKSAFISTSLLYVGGG